LLIAQAETSTQLLLQNPVLLLEVLEDLLLFSIEPASPNRHEKDLGVKSLFT
jgi:hypothetical protein